MFVAHLFACIYIGWGNIEYYKLNYELTWLTNFELFELHWFEK